MKVVFTRSLVSMAALAALASVANAAIVFDTFGPNGEYNTGSGMTISGAASSVGTEFDQGAQFSPTQSGILTAVDVAIGNVNGTNGATFTLYNDAAGQPGTVLQTWNITGLGGFGGNNAIIQITDNSNISLAAGTNYWLIASCPRDTWDAWNFNNQGFTGTVAVSNDNHTWGTGSGATLPAFRIEANAVPEPASMVALGIGAVALIRRRRK